MAREPWWRFFGPWPLQPLPVAGITSLLSIALGLDSGPWVEQWPNLVVGGVVALVLWALLASARRWASEVVARWLGYIGVLALASLVVTAIRFSSGVLPGSTDPAQRFVAPAISTTIFLIVVQGILGSAQARLRRENARATEAIDSLQQQQMALLKADEAVRQQVAVVLHDRVQAGLVSACLRLQTARSADESVVEQQRAIGEVIRQLEQLRALDLRRAVRSLSPNLRDVDMQTALEDLAEVWSPGVSVEVRIAGEVPKDRDLRLGSYRIIEQGLLNAVSHGRATTCRIDVTVTDRVMIGVDDDGVGLGDDAAAGLGSALLDTWCRTLGGSWHWEVSALGGVRTYAELPLPAH